jgi:hypothetical protein
MEIVNLDTLLDMLDSETARQFRSFLKHQPMFLTMLESGVFNVKNGQVVMNFNDMGKLMEVNIQIKAFNHGKYNKWLDN